MRIIHVVGARPNFMKIAPVIDAIKRHNSRQSADERRSSMEQILVHTGQHYDQSMSHGFFHDLGIPEPDINLGIGSGTHSEQTGKTMIAFEKVLVERRPHLVIVVGDVNSTLACTIAAKKLDIAVAHIEAGLRSGDMTMPEEINRKVTDSVSDYFFTTDELANDNLLSEGARPERIFFVGNVMIDTLLKHVERAAKSEILAKLGLERDGRTESYAVLTLHRPSNVDDRETLQGICDALTKISKTYRIVFPCHPRTAERLREFDLENYFGSSFEDGSRNIRIGPLGYLDFLRLNSKARLILTDSGGIQEEATILRVPCLTLRENTERPITVSQGTNRLCGNRKETILDAFQSVLAADYANIERPKKWDGKAAERIAKVLDQIATQRECAA